MNDWLPLAAVFMALVVGIGVVIGVGLGIAYSQDRVTRTSYDALRLGMSVQEVEAILGPEGVYWGSRAYTRRMHTLSRDDDEDVMRWKGRKGIIDLVISKEKGVTQKHFFEDGILTNHIMESR